MKTSGCERSFDVFRVLKKNKALVARIGETGVGGAGDGQGLQLVPLLVHPLLVVPQTPSFQYILRLISREMTILASSTP